MQNRIHVSLSADVCSGEGYVTPANAEKMEGLLEQGDLWFHDVVGDWVCQVKHLFARGQARNVGYVDSMDGLTATPDVIASTLFQSGLNPCDETMSVEYLAEADELDPFGLAEDTAKYAKTAEFAEAMADKARAMAQEYIRIHRTGGGAPVTSGNTFEDMVNLAIMEELLGESGPGVVTYDEISKLPFRNVDYFMDKVVLEDICLEPLDMTALPMQES